MKSLEEELDILKKIEEERVKVRVKELIPEEVDLYLEAYGDAVVYVHKQLKLRLKHRDEVWVKEL